MFLRGQSCSTPLSVWPHLFCGAGHEKRRGEQLKWSLAFWLYIGMGDAHHCSGPPISEMTCTVSSGALNSTIPYHAPSQGVGSERSPFWGFCFTYVYTLCHRTTKYDVATRGGGAYVSWIPPHFLSQYSRVTGLPNFGVFFACTLYHNDQIHPKF